MKNQKNFVLLILLLVGLATTTVASDDTEEIQPNDTQDLEVLASEALNPADELQQSTTNTNEHNHLYKIYNSDKRLVYECRDPKDERLSGLLKRSDKFLTTDSSSYYYLAE